MGDTEAEDVDLLGVGDVLLIEDLWREPLPREQALRRRRVQVLR